MSAMMTGIGASTAGSQRSRLANVNGGAEVIPPTWPVDTFGEQPSGTRASFMAAVLPVASASKKQMITVATSQPLALHSADEHAASVSEKSSKGRFLIDADS